MNDDDDDDDEDDDDDDEDEDEDEDEEEEEEEDDGGGDEAGFHPLLWLIVIVIYCIFPTSWCSTSWCLRVKSLFWIMGKNGVKISPSPVAEALFPSLEDLENPRDLLDVDR